MIISQQANQESLEEIFRAFFKRSDRILEIFRLTTQPESNFCLEVAKAQFKTKFPLQIHGFICVQDKLVGVSLIKTGDSE